MKGIYTKARAKINLTLEVIGKREDNYHNIKSVFQKINLYDELYIQKTKTNEIKIRSNTKELNNKKNILYKAYEKLKETNPNITGIEVRLNKKIPMQAGLAGGSTDCASFLLGMNQLFDLKLSKEEIKNIGKSLGADVVPCLYNKAVLAEGIGDIITPIPTNFKYYIIIIKPDISCNTKKMYKKIDEKKRFMQTKNSDKMVKALQQKDIELLTNNLYNIFEEALEEKHILQGIKEALIHQGAIRKFNDRFGVLCLWHI